MTAKEYLNRGANALHALEHHLAELNALREDPSVIRRAGDCRPTETAALNLIWLEESIAAERRRLEDITRRFLAVLNTVEQDPDRILLKQYYLLRRGIGELAEEYGCTPHTVYIRLKHALSRVQLPEDAAEPVSVEVTHEHF